MQCYFLTYIIATGCYMAINHTMFLHPKLSLLPKLVSIFNPECRSVKSLTGYPNLLNGFISCGVCVGITGRAVKTMTCRELKRYKLVEL